MHRVIDRFTIVGWAMFLMPVLTMWHEIGGHAAACAIQGGHVREIGAFYVQCTGLTGVADVLVACAGAGVNVLLSLVAFALWRRATGDATRLVLWLVWLTQAFVAAGYPAFSGITGAGDFGIGRGGGLANHGLPVYFAYAEAAAGIAAYAFLIRMGARTLSSMLGDGPATLPARREVTLGYYLTAGVGAWIVGLLNPIGLFVTIMSAAASTFGGLAGLLRVGAKIDPSGTPKPFALPPNRSMLLVGAVTLAGFALVFGPGWRPAPLCRRLPQRRRVRIFIDSFRGPR